MLKIHKALPLLAIAGMIAGCNIVPSAYQGTFVAPDGTSVIIEKDKVRIPNENLAAGGIVTDSHDIYEGLKQGLTGIYIAPAMYLNLDGQKFHDPTVARMGWPGVMAGWEQSESEYDVYVVFATKPQNAPTTPSLSARLYDANVLYFQAEKNTSGDLSELSAGRWTHALISTQEIDYGPTGFVKTWMIKTGDGSKTLKLKRR